MFPWSWRRADGSVARGTWGAVCDRAKRLGAGLCVAGMRRGDRVATLLWNNATHLECYLGIPAAGGVGPSIERAAARRMKLRTLRTMRATGS